MKLRTPAVPCALASSASGQKVRAEGPMGAMFARNARTAPGPEASAAHLSVDWCPCQAS